MASGTASQADPSTEPSPVASSAADIAPEGQPSASVNTPALPSRPHHESTVLKLKGLPYSTTEQQILDFFAGYQVKTIAFVFEPDGRPSGLAFAEFSTKEQALQALLKNGEYIGDRYVRLLHVTKQEMDEQVRLGTLAIPGAAAKLRNRLMRSQHRSNVAYLAGPLQLVPTVLPTTARPLMAVGSQISAPYSPAVGTGQVQLDARVWQNYQAPLTISTHFGAISGTQSLPRGPALQQPMQPTSLQPPSSQILSNTRAAAQNPTSGTVKVRGLPYRSSPAEILAFFQGYQYLPDSLQIGLDGLGRPSGEAWLTFVNPSEAMRAVRDLNRHYLGNRYLELSIC